MNEKDFYREQIIKMVEGINRCDILVYIYKAIEGVIDEDYKEDE